MKQKYSLFCFVLAALLTTTCSDDNYINDDIPSQLVVEGWIASGQYPIVMVSTTLQPSMETNKVSSLSGHILHWARVAIDDGEREVVLTGMRNNNYLPPYIYTTTDIRGEPGRTYRLTVKQEEYYAEAVTTIPEPVLIDDIEQRHITNDEKLRNLFVNFSNPQDSEHYYGIFYKCGTNAEQFTMSALGVFQTNPEEKQVRHACTKMSTIKEGKDISSFFSVGDTVCLRLATMDRVSYDFWTGYQSSMSQSGNFFVPYTQNIHSNISGGYGYWCGYGISDKWVIVE